MPTWRPSERKSLCLPINQLTCEAKQQIASLCREPDKVDTYKVSDGGTSHRFSVSYASAQET